MELWLRWSVVGRAFGFGVGGLGLVGRGLCWKVWGWWVGVGQWSFVLVRVGRSGFVLSGLRLVLSSCPFEWVGRCSGLLVREVRWLRLWVGL